MSSARGQANHHLYLARLLLEAWQQARAAGELRGTLVDQAWAPAVRLHLQRAWGWFLLALAQPAQLPPSLPDCVDALPAPPLGRSLPAELEECRQLESSPWLAPYLHESAPGEPAPARVGLAVSVDPASDPEALAATLDRLRDTFDRLGSFVDES